MSGKFKQNALTVEEQIVHLVSMGLEISDKEFAKTTLAQLSYFRFKRYAVFFRSKDKNGVPQNFKAGANFENIVRLYETDCKLRLIIFSAIQKIELIMKSSISNILCHKYGTHWYIDSNLFKSSFDHNEFMVHIKEECRMPDDKSIEAYMKTYSDPEYPPFWMIKETLTFGTISKIFEGLISTEDKTNIALDIGVPVNILESWLHGFTHIRNRIAHHSRIVYRTLKRAPLLPTRKKVCLFGRTGGH